MFNLALIFTGQGYQDKAVKEYEKILKIDPNDYQTLVNLAAIKYKQKDEITAVNLMERAAQAA
jgi:Tfp pilus assembly protein PilF